MTASVPTGLQLQLPNRRSVTEYDESELEIFRMLEDPKLPKHCTLVKSHVFSRLHRT